MRPPPQQSLCFAGTEHLSHRVCCNASCAHCGWRGCSAQVPGVARAPAGAAHRQCCVPAILRIGRHCLSGNDVGCVLLNSANTSAIDHRLMPPSKLARSSHKLTVRALLPAFAQMGGFGEEESARMLRRMVESTPHREHHSIEASGFNQWLLDLVLLRRWLRTSWAPDTQPVVVVPSLITQVQLLSALLRERAAAGRPRPHTIDAPWLRELVATDMAPTWSVTESGSQGPYWWPIYKALQKRSLHETYWRSVREEYHASGRGVDEAWIVTAFPFANHEDLYLATLLDQPASFVSRVIIGSLEGGMVRMKGPAARALSSMPAHRPILIALPYPTALTARSWFGGDARSRRPISVLFQGRTRNFKGQDAVRRAIVNTFRNNRGSVQRHFGVSGQQSRGHLGRLSTLALCKERGGQGGSVATSRFDLAERSDFCLEPAGDTPTRSHFYLAVLSGCIPVIFDQTRVSAQRSLWGPWGSVPDGETAATRDVEPRTAWAWRDRGLNYSNFAVILNADAVADGRVNVWLELARMATHDKGRIAALCRGLDRAAEWMHFLGGDTASSDAFSRFQRVVAARSFATNREGAKGRL